MSSRSKSHGTGEVGLLADEHVQRFLSIFAESADQCLLQLKTLSQQHGAEKSSKLYGVGLSSMSQLNPDVIREEIARMAIQYPEIQSLYKYAYVSLVHEMGLSEDGVPPLSEFYHVFSCRLSNIQDVAKNILFVDSPYLYKRCIYAECLRNALHDILRRSATAAVPVKSVLQKAIDGESVSEHVPTEKESIKGSVKGSVKDDVVSLAHPSSVGVRSVLIEGPCFF
jgi:hypothetical protein